MLETEVIAPVEAPALTPTLKLLSALFFASGASSLIFETIFSRLLTYTFGNTAHAVSTVLAVFLGGLALGAYVIGRFADRFTRPLRIYANLELLVGIYCLFVPWLFRALTQVYVFLYHHFQPGPASLTALRFGLSAIPIAAPAFLMGGTLPALARFIGSTSTDFQTQINRLYGWNTFGAAVGTLASTYLLMPTLGITGTIWTASALNFTIFIFASRLSLRLSGAVADEDLLPGTSLAHYTTADRSRWFLYALAFFTGAGALAYEVIWTHIQAFTIGSTVYAFGIMLFTVLCGLAIGAQVVARRMHDSESWVPALALSLVGLGAAVLLTTPVWGLLNFVFESDIRITLLSGVIGLFVLRILWKKAIAWRTRVAITEKRPGHRWALALLIVLGLIPLGLLLRGSSTRYFLATEMVRFLCAFYLIIVPACLLGMSFPLLLSLSASSTKRLGADVGGIYSANTLGAIVGSIITGFFILPKLGSQTTLRALGSLNVFLGLLVASLWLSSRARRLALAGAGSVALLLGWIVVPSWNGSRLMRGSYVYFNLAQIPDRVLYMREDIQGGLTSVIQDGPIHTLLSNGKFQGNNGGEAAAQSRFALIPSLFSRHFDRALVIGLGTGYTTKALSLFPFQRIDVAELAPHIVEAARLWFADVNDGVLDRDPRVKVTITDGRNFLLLSRERYDLVTIEITSIWISGEADLYNREFYELCRDHLSSHGVLQQWVQIHHMRTQDLLVIFNTAAQVFPHLAFFLGPHQALLVASNDPLDFDYAQVQTLDEIPGIKAELARLHVPSLMSFLGEIILYDNSVRRALAFLPRGGAQERFVSTDLYPYLEYATPKGNVVPYNTVEANRDFLLKLRPLPLPPELRITSLPSENEKNLVLGYVAERQGDIPRAINHFQQAHGAVQERAQREITRLSNR